MSESRSESRLARVFRRANADNRAAFVAYMTAGFPNAETSREIFRALAQHADLIEVGIPFTDPMMDGPTIQAAADEALGNGFRVAQTFDAVRAVTEAGGQAVIMSYWNPVLQYGPERFAEELAAAGGLGSIIPDLLPEEAERWAKACEQHDLSPVYLVAPSTTPERMATTVAAGNGFIYAASHMGVTGAQEAVSSHARELVERTREATDLPVAVGLGVRDGQQAAAIAEFADGVIVGSALIQAAQEGQDKLVALARELREGCQR